MSLDIRFNRKEAIKAGLKLEIWPNNGLYDEEDTQEYKDWCNSSTEVVYIPEKDHCVINFSNNNKYICVTGNKWGSTYYPLTKWLKDNNIKWAEF